MAKVLVAQHETQGFAQMRYPAIVRSCSRTLILMWEALPSGPPFSAQARASLYFSRSFDGGHSWEQPQPFPEVKLPTGQPKHSCTSCSEDNLKVPGLHNPSFLLDHVTGRVFCFYTHTSDSGELSLQVSSTDDDGESWTHRDITSMIIAGRDFEMAWVPRGRGTQLMGGTWSQRLAHAGVVVTPSGERRAVFIGSDDQGVSWWSSQPVGTHVDHCSVMQSSDQEKVWMLMKECSSAEKLWAVSTDGGRSFSQPNREVDSELIDLVSPLEPVFPGAAAGSAHASVVSYVGEKRYCSGDCSALMLSLDGGKTFAPAVWFDAQSYGWVDVVSSADAQVFAVASIGPAGVMCETIDFSQLPLQELAQEWKRQA